MAFLQRLARALAHEGKPLSWVTPTGLPWVNRYHEPILNRVSLWLSDVSVRITVADGNKKEIDKDRASNGCQYGGESNKIKLDAQELLSGNSDHCCDNGRSQR